MEFSAQQIASVLGGTVEGDPEVKVNNFSKIEEGKPGTLTFLANPKYEHFIYQTEASIVLVNNDFTPAEPVKEIGRSTRLNSSHSRKSRMPSSA